MQTFVRALTHSSSANTVWQRVTYTHLSSLKVCVTIPLPISFTYNNKHHASIVIVTKAITEIKLIPSCINHAQDQKERQRAVPSLVLALQLVERQTEHGPAQI